MPRRLTFLLTTTIVWSLLLPTPVMAHHASSHTATTPSAFVGFETSNPYLVFDKNTITNSTLIAYASYGTERYRISMRAGSGQTTNDCQKYTGPGTSGGWLPNGTYYPNFYYKNWGSAVVQGYVWELGSKVCSNGSVTRTELFIHSSGIEGTAWNGVYSTQGCIKISQLDRYSASGSSLRPFLRSAYHPDSEVLSVIS